MVAVAIRGNAQNRGKRTPPNHLFPAILATRRGRLPPPPSVRPAVMGCMVGDGLHGG